MCKKVLAAIGLALFFVSVTGCSTDIPVATVEQKYMSPASKFVQLSDGVRLHYRDEGPRDAPIIILAHGSNASLHTWEPWVKALSPKWRVVSFDFPAHGLTGPSVSNVYSGTSYVKVVDELAGVLKLDRFVLAGNSMGGGVAWRYALAHPEKVAGLVLVDAAAYPKEGGKPPLIFQLARAPVLGDMLSAFTTKSMLEANLKQVIVDDSLVTPDMAQRYYDLLMRDGNRKATLARLRSQPDAPDAYKSIPTINVPTLVLWGEADPWIPFDDAKRLAREIKGAKLVSYPNIGHLPQEEQATETAAEVDAFMQSISAPKPQ